MPKRVRAPPPATIDGPTVEEVTEELGDALDNKKGKTERPITVCDTSFHITVNTNQRYGSKSAITEDMKPLYFAMRNVFGDPAAVKEVVEILNIDDEYEKVVGATHTDIGVEYSEKAGLHAHVLFTITHRTKLRMHLKKLRKQLDKHLPHLAKKAPHTFVRYVPDQKQIVKDYIYKTVNNEPLKMREGMIFEEGTPSCTCDCKIADMSQFFSD